jgi:hypothetical protein
MGNDNDDRDFSRTVGVAVLGALAGGAMVVMSLCAATGKEIPPAIAASFGVCVGAVAGLLSPRRD